MTVPGGSPLQYPPGSQPAVKRVSRARAPSTTDYKNFREGDEWLDKSSDDWYKLADITQNTALWVLIGGTGAVVDFTVPSGTSPVVADSEGSISITAGTGVTVSGGTNSYEIGLAGGEIAVDSFTVPSGTSPVVPDATGAISITASAGITVTGGLNTYAIGLTGGGAGIDSVSVDANSGPGTDPVLPDVNGLITVTGAQVAAGTVGSNVIRTNSIAANAYTIDIQQTSTASVKDTTKNGVSHFNSAQFSQDQGFISSTYPSFGAYLNPGVTNQTGDGTDYVIVYNNEFFDSEGAFDTTTGAYTIPAGLGGIWVFAVKVGILTATATHLSATVTMSASGSVNQVYEVNPYACRNNINDVYTVAFTSIESVTAGVVMNVTLKVSGGTKTAGVNGSTTLFTTFEGFRLQS